MIWIVFGKGFCMSIVHSGVSLCLSNNVILENYQTFLKDLLIFWVSIGPFLAVKIYLQYPSMWID